MATTPFLVGIGASLSSSTSAVSVSYPADIISGDFIVLATIGANQASATPSGWTHLGSSVGTGPAGTAGGICIDLYYKFATGSETSSQTVADSGDFTAGLMVAYRNVSSSSPIDNYSTAIAATASTAVSCPSVTTSSDNCLIVNFVASDVDSTGSRLSGWTNANLTGITERFDNGTTQGSGGGLGIAQGPLATAGASGVTTAILSAAATQALFTIAIKADTTPSFSVGPMQITMDRNPARLLAPTDTTFYDVFKLFSTGSKSMGIASYLNFFSMKPDGTAVYFGSERYVFEATLTTPFDITTAVYSGVNKDLTVLGHSYGYCGQFSSDGTKFYYAPDNSYDFKIFSVAVPFDITTINTTAISSISLTGDAQTLYWAPDGSNFYYIPRGITGTIYRVSVSVPWTFTGASTTSLTLPTDIKAISVIISPDGKKLVVSGFDVSVPGYKYILDQYRLPTPFSLSGAVYTGYYNEIITSSGNRNPVGLAWNSNGTRLITGDYDRVFYQYNTERYVDASVKNFVLTGIDAQTKVGRKVPADTGTVNLTGMDTGLIKRSVLPAEPVSFTLTGMDVVLDYQPGYTIVASPGSIVFSGKASTLAYNRVLTTNLYPMVLTGQDTLGKKNYKTQAETGVFTLTGYNADLSNLKKIFAETAPFVIGSPNTTLRATRKIAITSYTMTRTSPAAALRKDKKLIASTGSFIITPQEIGSYLDVPSLSFNSTFLAPTFVGERAGPRILPLVHNFQVAYHAPSIKKGVKIIMETKEFEVSFGARFYKLETINTCSGVNVPLSHIQDSKKLEADAYMDLFEILLSDNSARIFLKMNKTMSWQGNVYEGTGIKIEGVATYADEQTSRPKLSIFNPEGVFSSLVDNGTLDNARIFRIRVLKEHLAADLPIYRRQQWRVRRVASLKTPYIILELRDMLDGQNFLTPGRMFLPPDFKAVSLQ